MKKILIVEDDVDTLELMETILLQEGYAVIKVKREIVIEEIAGIKPDLAIIDFMLPFGLGTEICQQIRSNVSTKNIPVILYSANNNIEELVKQSGADLYIAKPFDVENLVDQVNAMVNRQNAAYFF